MTDTPGDTIPPRRQYTLQTLLWLTLLVGLGVGYFILSRRLVEQQRELAELREEVGYFAVEDPSKIQVLSVPTHDAGAMKWKIYLPPDSRWGLHCKTRDIPTSGYDEVSGPGGSLGDVRGEFVLETFLSRDADDKRRFSLRVGGATTSFELSEAEVQERFAARSSEERRAGSPALEKLDPADRVELLRYRVNSAGSPPTQAGATTQPTAGILIWLERQP